MRTMSPPIHAEARANVMERETAQALAQAVRQEAPVAVSDYAQMHLAHDLGRIAVHPPIQAKLAVSEPGEEEEEAEGVGGAVMRMPEAESREEEEREEEEEGPGAVAGEVQRKPLGLELSSYRVTPPVQREAAVAGEEEEEKPPAQDLAEAGGALPSIQRTRSPSLEEEARSIQEAARLGTSGASGPLPHLNAIQKSFGRFDISGVAAHTDAAAASGARAMGAAAFTMGNHVAFAGAPSLHTAAHEAAHVIQQRAGVELAGGVGHAGDAHEQHADAVADMVVAGRSCEALLRQRAQPIERSQSPGAVLPDQAGRHGAHFSKALQRKASGPIQMRAAAGKKAVVAVKSGLWMRATPAGKKMQLLAKGTAVDVVGEHKSTAMGHRWFHVKLGERYGYVARRFVQVVAAERRGTGLADWAERLVARAKQLFSRTKGRGAKHQQATGKPGHLKKITHSDCDSVIEALQKEKGYKYAPFVYKTGRKLEGARWRGVTKGNSGGWCATAVARLFRMITGLSKTGHGSQWDSNMKDAIKKGEVPYRKEEQPKYANLPNCSVLVWKRGDFGHVCIVVDDRWYSDFFSDPGGQMHGGVNPDVVYVPTAIPK